MKIIKVAQHTDNYHRWTSNSDNNRGNIGEMEDYMVESVTKKKIAYCLAKIIPMITLLFEWSGIYGVKQYSGLAYIFYNKFSSYLGLIIIFGEMLLKIKTKYKIILNLLGHVLFWLPLFLSAITETNNMSNLTVMFYVSFFLAIMSLILQLLMSKGKERVFKDI